MKDLLELECGARGSEVAEPIPHVCRCAKPKIHPADGSTEDAWHVCTCGVRWTDERTLVSGYQLNEAELRDVEAFSRTALHAQRMNAFSVDVDGPLVVRIAELIGRMRG